MRKHRPQIAWLRFLSLVLMTLGTGLQPRAAGADDLRFFGACDGSAAVALGPARIVVANDDTDVLIEYDLSGDAPKSVRDVSLDTHLAQAEWKKEADFEGAAAIDDRIYWIGSHGRNVEGEPRPERRILVATSAGLEPVGKPYKVLIDALIEQDGIWNIGLAKAIGNQGDDVEMLAPEKQGLNIEALGFLPGTDGQTPAALIGLRNPLGPELKAIMIPLLNIREVVDGAKPLFATKPLLLSLDGLGVRDLLWSSARKELLILAGPTGEGDDFRLYRWSGDSEKNPVLVTRLNHLHAEALALGSDDGSVLALADQGDDAVVDVPQAACKHPLAAG